MHSSDARWLRCWLRNNLIGTIAVVCLLVGLRFVGDLPLSRQTRLASETKVANRVDAVQETPDAGRASIGSQAVAPTGWRRTNAGWEDASSWHIPQQTLIEIIERQQSREPQWVQLSLASLRRISPIVFAMAQLTAICFIVWLASLSRNESARPEIWKR